MFILNGQCRSIYNHNRFVFLDYDLSVPEIVTWVSRCETDQRYATNGSIWPMAPFGNARVGHGIKGRLVTFWLILIWGQHTASANRLFQLPTQSSTKWFADAGTSVQSLHDRSEVSAYIRSLMAVKMSLSYLPARLRWYIHRILQLAAFSVIDTPWVLCLWGLVSLVVSYHILISKHSSSHINWILTEVFTSTG